MRKVFLGLLLLFVGCNGGGGGGGSKDKKEPDPCAGPVLCLNTDWGDQYAVFYNGPAACLLGSDGDTFAVVFGVINQSNETAILGLSGPANKCRFGVFNDGMIDYNMDGTFDEDLLDVVGSLSICNEEMKITGVEFNLNNLHWFIQDILAYYDGMTTLSRSGFLHTESAMTFDEVSDVKDKLHMLRQLLGEEE